MSKFLIGLVAVVVIGGGVYYMKSAPAVDTGTSDTGTTESTVMNTSLGGLLDSGKSLQCAVNTTEEGVNTTGTVYIANKMIRGDFSSTPKGQPAIASHLLINNESAFLWSSASPEGIKFSLDTAKSGGSAGIDYTAKKDYSCSSWSADSSKFVVPSDIQFSDFEALLKKSQAR